MVLSEIVVDEEGHQTTSKTVIGNGMDDEFGSLGNRVWLMMKG